MDDSTWRWLLGGIGGLIVLAIGKLWDRVTRVDESAANRYESNRKAMLDGDAVLHGRINEISGRMATKADLQHAEGRLERLLEQHERRQSERHVEVLKRLDTMGSHS